MQRVNAEPSFVDLSLADLGGPRATAFFERCTAEIPFGRLAEAVGDLYHATLAGGSVGGSLGGRPHWPVVTMLKIVFLQKVFGLSDPAAEEMLKDRISFRRFVGLSFDDATPDHSTIALFRKRLLEHGHGSTLFDESLVVLEERGLLVKQGTLIDATLVEAPMGRKRPADTSAGDAGESTADPLASKTAKNGRAHHGYRVHTATDRRGIVTDYVYDTARVSEHTHFDHLARNEDQTVYADSGCRSKARVKALRQRGVKARFCHRRVRGQAELTPRQRRMNKLIAPIRAFVEHPYGWFKQRLPYRSRARYRGLARNGLDFALSALAWNFCRALSLKPMTT